MSGVENYDHDRVVAMIVASNDALAPEEQRWGQVRRIVMSPTRMDALRARTSPSDALLPWTALAIEVSPLCDDSFVMLINDFGVPLGVFSFETGLTHWFDVATFDRWMAPALKFVEDWSPERIGSRLTSYGVVR